MSTWIAPQGSTPEAAEWQEIGGVGTLGWEPSEYDPALDAPYPVNSRVEWSIPIRNVSGKFTRFVHGISKREYQVVRGLERKQLLHKGGKP